MANTNKMSFAVSLTPKIAMDAADGVNVAQEVINENIRKTLGGSGEITANSGDTTFNVSSTGATNGVDNAGSTEGTSGWTNGTYGYVTSNATTITSDTNTDMIFIKNSGFVYDSTATNNITTTAGTAGTDTVDVKMDTSVSSTLSGTDTVIAELDCGEAMLLPRPGTGCALVLASSSAHMACEVTVIST